MTPESPQSSPLFTAWIDPITGNAACTCGAGPVGRGEVRRFMRRHPSECTKRRMFARQLAKGVRCVEDRRTNEEEPEKRPVRRGVT
jgi:hypothetical protein